MLRFFSWHWDFVGFGTSLLCALHCMLMPLILLLGIFEGAHWLMNPLGEWIFIGTSIGIASWSLLPSYFNKHHNMRPLLIAGLGFLGLFFAQIMFVTIVHGLMAVGGGLIAYAHFYNWQLTYQLKPRAIKTRYWTTHSRIITITLLLLCCLGLYRALVHDNTPPSRKEMLQVVWDLQD